MGEEGLQAGPPWHIEQRLLQLLAIRSITNGDYAHAESIIGSGVGSAALRLTKCIDEFDRSAVSSVVEDWMGVALECDLRSRGTPGTVYEDVASALGHDLTVAAVPGHSVFTLLNHRFASAMLLALTNGGRLCVQTATAETLFEPLGRLHGLVLVDMERFRLGKQPDEGSDRWMEHLRALSARHGFGASVEIEGIVEVHATRADIPITTAIRLAHPRVSGVVGVRHGLPTDRAYRSTAEDRKVHFICGFPRDESIFKTFRDSMISFQSNGAAVWHEVGSLAEARGALSLPSRGFVIGMHGDLGDVLDPTVVVLGGRKVGVPELLSGISLPNDSFVVALVCFAGGGFRDSLGGAHAMPDQFLEAGARLVAASRFPVWMSHATVEPTKRFLRALQFANPSDDFATAAVATVRWTEDIRAVERHPRWWSGLACWTRPERMAERE